MYEYTLRIVFSIYVNFCIEFVNGLYSMGMDHVTVYAVCADVASGIFSDVFNFRHTSTGPDLMLSFWCEHSQ